MLPELRALSARASIANVMADYCHAFDGRDLSRFMSVWWEDAYWNLAGAPANSIVGHQQIEDTYYNAIRGTWKSSSHATCNMHIRFEADDVAHVESTILVVGFDYTGKFKAIGAIYRDQFVERSGIWKLVRRDVVRNVQFETDK